MKINNGCYVFVFEGMLLIAMRINILINNTNIWESSYGSYLGHWPAG